MSTSKSSTEDSSPRNKLFHEILNDHINESNIKQSEIAEMLGFQAPNIITMFKQGKSRVPLDKVPDFARVLQKDPKEYMRIAMMEYNPQLLKAIERVFGDAISANEKEILNEMRSLSSNKNKVIRINTIAKKQALEEFVNSMDDYVS